MIVLCIERQDYLENLRGKVLVKFDLNMVSMEVKLFLVGLIVLYQRKYLLVRFTKFGSPCVYECEVQYGKRSVDSGGLKGFSRIFSDVGVEPR